MREHSVHSDAADGAEVTVVIEGPPRVVVLRGVEEVEAQRDRWGELDWRRIDAQIDYFLAVIAARPEVIEPYVVLIERGGRVAAMAVARREQLPLECNVGYRTVYRPTLTAVTVVHGGIEATSDVDEQLLFDELQAVLKRGEADVLFLPKLRTDSVVFRATQAAPFLRRQHPLVTNHHWFLSLPASYDAYLQSRSKKVRDNAKTYRKRLARDYGENVEFRTYTTEPDMERVFSDIASVAERTYQSGLGVAFSDAAERRQLAHLGASRGWFRAYVLYVDGLPVAFWQGFTHRGTFFTGTPGYDPAFADYSVGTLVLHHMVNQLIAEESVEAIDFGFGDADYKRRFSNGEWEEADVMLFAPTLRAIRVNALCSAIRSGVEITKRALGDHRIAAVKKRWRSRLKSSH